MMADNRQLTKTYVRTPPALPPAQGARKLVRYLVGAALSPAYWLLAHCLRTPGLRFHRRCAALGLQLLFRRDAPLPLGWSYEFMFRPMDSTRYFEFDFMWRALAGIPFARYLDVSSPRLFPLLLIRDRRALSADLMNPDREDLATTESLLRATGARGRCRLHGSTIAEASFRVEAFDVITSISVLEHIPEDAGAVRTMWDLLKPGGRLLLTVPCAARASEQYIDYNQYRVLSPDALGYVFWQRFYDPSTLEERIYRVTGQPDRCAVYGEKIAGAFQHNAEHKRRAFFSTYPFWRKPYMMGQDYGYFPSVADLPGEGVIAMEFVKR